MEEFGAVENLRRAWLSKERERNAGVYVTRNTTFRTTLLLARITQLAATKPLPCAFIFLFLSFSYPTQYFAVTRKKKENGQCIFICITSQSRNTDADTFDDEINGYKRDRKKG